MKHTIKIITALLLLPLTALHAADIKGVETSPGLTILGRYVAIDNVCARPNLTLLPDGAIVALIYGHPSHLTGPGDVQCWTSRDGVGQWELRGTVAEHDAESNREDVGADPRPDRPASVGGPDLRSSRPRKRPRLSLDRSTGRWEFRDGLV